MVKCIAVKCNSGYKKKRCSEEQTRRFFYVPKDKNLIKKLQRAILNSISKLEKVKQFVTNIFLKVTWSAKEQLRSIYIYNMATGARKPVKVLSASWCHSQKLKIEIRKNQKHGFIAREKSMLVSSYSFFITLQFFE